jgi:predicted DNA-binding transcriptional regulator YafY
MSRSTSLSTLLQGAIKQTVFHIEYESLRGKISSRDIQPIGIYGKDGFWFCPAYCFLREDFRVFRCDRMRSVVPSSTKPMNLQHIHLGNRKIESQSKQRRVQLYVELSKEGAQRCEGEVWLSSRLHFRKDGTAWLEGDFPISDIPFYADFFICLGDEATVQDPPELVDCIKQKLLKMLDKYKGSVVVNLSHYIDSLFLLCFNKGER